MAYTKIDLIKQLARQMGALLADSTIGSVPNRQVFNDEFLQFANASQLQGKQVYTYGSPTPGSAFINNFVPGNVPTIQLIPSLAATPTAGYLILDYYTIDELKEIAERAIKAAGKWHFPEVSGTIAVVATQYEYAVPSEFSFIARMHFVPTSGTAFDDPDQFSIPRHWWNIEKGPSGPGRIIFNPEYVDLANYDAEYVRIIGQGMPPLLPNDSSAYTDLLEEYLVAWGVKELSFRRIQEGEMWLAKYRAARDMVTEEEAKIATGVAANAVRV